MSKNISLMAENKLKTSKTSKKPKDILRIEDIPLVAINIRIWKFWSLIIGRQLWRRFFIMVPLLFLNVTQFFYLFYINEIPAEKIPNAFLATLILNTNLRAINVCLHRDEYEELLEYLRQLYLEVMRMNDVKIQKMLKEVTKTAQKLTKINLIMGFALCGVSLIYPQLVNEGRVLPVSVYIPHIDLYKTPLFEITYCCHFLMTPNGVFMFIPSTIVLVSFMMFAILMCRILHHKLRNLPNLEITKVHEEILWCVKYQLALFKFVEHINSVTHRIFLLEYLLYGSMLCALMYSMIIVNTYVDILIAFVYFLVIFAQCFLLYSYGNELYMESLEVATAAYDVNWYDYDVVTRKSLQLLILRSQRPCAILLGNVYPMNLERLYYLLKIAYSSYTLLRRLYG